MISILKKELNSFLGSLIGYMVVVVFLLLNGLFLWIFPGSFNLLDAGYAGLDGLFFLAPWVFLFLIPALTMRFFADEIKTGTIELILTKPISELSLVLGKFFAGLTLCIIALSPTLIYVVSIYFLGQPQGNLDWGATIGSYIGLVFLSGIYVSIGVFASSLTENQIVSFILALFFCFFCFSGFEQIATLLSHTGLELSIDKLGISYHYNAISRGVIDTRDVLYFISVMSLFIYGSKLSLQSRKW
ncbi:MAG: gliding motility-associated ABC transporter permease subunit GldF [Flavobacteriales bacterium]|jgi:ABC-2 type transport system permease protein|tara:strand:- start:82 stop:813 length:732 start_codon:yes stop_codon:yes gene_type:complete